MGLLRDIVPSLTLVQDAVHFILRHLSVIRTSIDELRDTSEIKAVQPIRKQLTDDLKLLQEKSCDNIYTLNSVMHEIDESHFYIDVIKSYYL